MRTDSSRSLVVLGSLISSLALGECGNFGVVVHIVNENPLTMDLFSVTTYSPLNQ
jgi:hypothetical protein